MRLADTSGADPRERVVTASPESRTASGEGVEPPATPDRHYHSTTVPPRCPACNWNSMIIPVPEHRSLSPLRE